MAQTLKFGKGTWATKTGSSMAYNDQNGNYKPLPFNVERDSIATRVNKQGLIEVVGKDKLRIDYTDSAKGVALLEPSRTNLITYSSDLSVLSKVSTGTASSPSTTANYAIAPDGTMTATRVVFNLNGGTTNNDRSILRQSIPSGSDYYFSIYVKSTNGTEQKVMWHDGGEFVTEIVTNEWKRITYDARELGITYGGIALNGNANLDVSDILVWGFQVEEGSYATSYIPTSGSTVTRQADVVNGSGNSEVFNDSEGVLFADIAALANDGTNRQISISDGYTSQRVYFGFRTNTNEFILSSRDSSYLIGNVSDVTNFNKYAFQYKSGNFKAFVNGFNYDLNLNGGLLPTGLNTLNFNDGAGGADYYGKTKEIGYYDATLTDSELEYLTSYRSLNELVTELNLNTL